ncbi:FecR domain-containing protein [Sulfurospirillum sp. 1307]|jgi:hypothetical protein
MARILLTFFLMLSFTFGANVAIVKKANGEVFAKRGEKLENLSVGDKLQNGDILITKASSSIGVLFDDGTALSLGSNSLLSIDKYIFKPAKNEFDFDINMKKGLASFESGKIGKLKPSAVKFRVPEGTIGIRGTKFYVEVK